MRVRATSWQSLFGAVALAALHTPRSQGAYTAGYKSGSQPAAQLGLPVWCPTLERHHVKKMVPVLAFASSGPFVSGFLRANKLIYLILLTALFINLFFPPAFSVVPPPPTCFGDPAFVASIPSLGVAVFINAPCDFFMASVSPLKRRLPIPPLLPELSPFTFLAVEMRILSKIMFLCYWAVVI